MLQPKRVKYRKVQKAKGNMKGISGRGNQLSNGMFGIKSIDQNLLTSRQIEAARIAATRYMKREGQLWIKIFPDKPITKKPLEVRMGKVKELQIILLPLSNLVESCLKLEEYPWM